MKTIDRIIDCLNKWEPQLLAGGYKIAAQAPVGVVKGRYDYDRPDVGRDWDDTGSAYSDKVPGANTKVKHPNSLRSKRGFKKKKSWW